MNIKSTYILLALCLVSVGLSFFWLSKPEFSEHIDVYPTPKIIDTFELTDHLNQTFGNAQLKKKWSLVFLGYLSCPDICPMTMAKLSRLVPKLQALTNTPIQVLFISVDPDRDTETKRKSYVEYFHPQILGLSTEHKKLFPFVSNLGLMYSLPDTMSERYFVDHSASVMVINPESRIVARLKPKLVDNQVPTINEESVLKDFKKLLTL